MAYKNKIFMILCAFAAAVNSHGQIISNTSIFSFDSTVDNRYVNSYSGKDYTYFCDFYAIDAVRDRNDKLIFGCGADRCHNIIYYFDEKLKADIVGYKKDTLRNFIVDLGRIAVTANGNIYAIDHYSNTIYYWNRKKISYKPAGSVEKKYSFPLDICKDSDDNLYILDSGDKYVYKYNTNNKVFVNISSLNKVIDLNEYYTPEWNIPCGIEKTSHGFYIIYYGGAIVKYSLAGEFVDYFWIDESNLGLFPAPEESISETWLKSITSDIYGNIYVLDSKAGFIHIFKESLDYICSWNDPAHPVKEDSSDISFIPGYNYFFLSNPWGFYSYTFNLKSAAVVIDNTFIYPELVNGEYRGINMKAKALSNISLDIMVKSEDTQVKLIDNDPITQYEDYYYTWNGRDRQGNIIPYGNYTLQVLIDDTLANEFDIEVKAAPQLSITNPDGEIIDTTNQQIDYYYQVIDSGYVKISVSTIDDYLSQQDGRETFLHEGEAVPGHYSQAVTGFIAGNKLEDDYYNINFYILPPELKDYTIPAGKKSRIFVVNKQEFEIGSLTNNTKGFNPYNAAMVTMEARFSQNEGSYVTVDIVDEHDEHVANLFDHKYLSEGEKSLSWNGYDNDFVLMPDGNYKFHVTAEQDYIDGPVESQGGLFALDTTPAAISLLNGKEVYYISPDEPSSVGVKDSFSLGFSFNEETDAECTVRDKNGEPVKTLAYFPDLMPGETASITWDGTDTGFQFVEDGRYSITIVYEDYFGNSMIKRIPVYVDNNRMAEGASDEILFASDPFIVHAYKSGTQYCPAIEKIGEEYLFAWESEAQDGSGQGIYARRFDAVFNPQGNEFRVNSYTTGDQTRPAISKIEGGFVIAWNSYGQDGSDWGIYARRFDESFNPVGAEFQVNTYTADTQFDPAIAQTQDGFVIAWESRVGGLYANQIRAQRFDRFGNKTGGEFMVHTSVSPQIYCTDAEEIADGFIIAWEAYIIDGSNQGVFAQKFDNNGNKSGGEFQVNTYTAGFQGRPSIASITDGFVIIWISDNQDESGFGVYAQKFDNNCNRIGGEVRINTYNHYYRFYPRIVGIKDGFVATWHSDEPGNSGYGVYARLFDNECNPEGDEFKVSSFNISSYVERIYLNVAVETNNGFVISWQSEGTDGQRYNVLAKEYTWHTIPEGANLAAAIVSPEEETYTALHDFSIKGMASDAYIDRYRLSLSDGGETKVLTQEQGRNVTGELHYFNILSCMKGIDYTVSLEAWDRAGNSRQDHFTLVRAPVSEEFIEGFGIDRYYSSIANPPTVTFDLLESSDVVLTIVNESAVIERTFDLGTRPDSPVTCPLDITGLADGPYTLAITVDNPYNGTVESTLKFFIDNTAPAVSIGDVGTYFSSQTNVPVPVSVEEDNLDRVSLYIVDEEDNPVKTILETNLPTDCDEAAFDPLSIGEGSYNIVLYAEDLAGNSASCEHLIVIDRTCPVVTFTSPDFSAVLTGTVSLNAGIYDEGGAADYTLILKRESTEEVILTGTGPSISHSWDTAAYGKEAFAATFKVVSRDNAGNTALVQKPVIIDNNPPDVSLFFEDEPVMVGDILYINAANRLYIKTEPADAYSTVTSVFYSINDGGWTGYSGPVMLTEEGSYSVKAYGMDNFGNESTISELMFAIDAAPPLYTVTIGDPKYASGGNVYVPLENNIMVEATDGEGPYASGVKTIEYRVDEGLWEDYTLEGIRIYSEGPKDISLKITDMVGNTTEEYTGSVIIDIAPPLTSIGTDGNIYRSYERNIVALGEDSHVTLDAVDLGHQEYCSGVNKTYYCLDGELSEYAESFLITEGTVHDFYCYSIDNVGNEEQYEPLKLEVDTVPPEVELVAETFIYESGNILFSKTGNSFGFEAEDNFSGVDTMFYTINGTDYSIYNNPFSFDEEADVTVSYYAVDYIGLASEIKTRRIITDDTPPVTQMMTNRPLVEIDGTLYADSRYLFSWQAYDMASGVSDTVVIIDGVTLETEPPEYTFTDEGVHTIEFYSIDNLGNTEEKHEVVIITPIPDMTPPVSTVVSSYEPYSDGSMDFYRGDVVFTMEAVDPCSENESYASGVEKIVYAIDGGEEMVYRGEDIAFQSQGLHEITYHAIDIAGNTEEKKYYFLTIDNSPPESACTAPGTDNIVIDSVLYITESAPVGITSIDEYCGVKEIFYRIDEEGEWHTYEQPLVLSAGTYRLDYYAVDNLGNTEETKSVSIKTITDYNIVSYETAFTRTKPDSISDYDVNGETIAYIKGCGRKHHIFVDDLDRKYGHVCGAGRKISLLPEQRVDIALSGPHIVTSETRNNSRDIFLYTKEGRRQEGKRLSYNGGNGCPVIAGNNVYWIHHEAGVDTVYVYDIEQEYESVLFVSDYPVGLLASHNNLPTFVVSEPYSDTLYAFENSEIKVLFEKQVTNDDERITGCSVSESLLAMESVVNGERMIHLFHRDEETILIGSFPGKNPQVSRDYMLFVEEKEGCEVLSYYNIINKVKTGMVKSASINGYILDKKGNVFVEREYNPYMEMKPFGNMYDRLYRRWCGFFRHFHMTQVVYLKTIGNDSLVSNITYSTGRTSFAYNRYCDAGDFIYADSDAIFTMLLPQKCGLHHIQTFDGEKENIDENYLGFTAEKDIVVIVVREKKKGDRYGYRYDKQPHGCKDRKLHGLGCHFMGADVECFTISKGETFGMDGTGSQVFAPIVFVVEDR